MPDIKNYDPAADFAHHKAEFDRCSNIFLRHTDLTDKLVLDLGSGSGGHMGFLVNCGCRHTIGIDLQDYETLWDGNFKAKLLTRYRQYGADFAPERCQFLRMNAEEMLFKDKLFDFVLSINAFEHIAAPDKALGEIWRVLKPGGYAFIQFDPVYYCDTGSHTFDFYGEPWGHLVHSEQEFAAKLIAAGTPEGILIDLKYGINRKTVGYFNELFEQAVTQRYFEKIVSYNWSGVVAESHLTHPNFALLCQKYSKEELLFRGMNILLRKV